MQFNYKYRVKTSDLWQTSMYYAYSSYLGIVNIVCIIAAVVLIVSKWKGASDIFRTFMVFFLLLFTVIQPFVIYLRARSALIKKGYPELELTFSQAGVSVIANGQKQFIKWQGVFKIVRKPTIIIIYMVDGAGYILRNSLLKDTRNELYDFVVRMIKESR